MTPKKPPKKPAKQPRKTSPKTKAVVKGKAKTDRQAKAKTGPQKPTRKAKPSAGVGAKTVIAILESRDPVAALKKYTATLSSKITKIEAQVWLGAAALLLGQPARGDQGRSTVEAIVDGVLDAWPRLPDRTGSHAQDFLRNAAARVVDATRMDRLGDHAPADASPDLLFALACGFGRLGDRDHLMAWLARALTAGVSPAQIRRTPDMARYVSEPEVVRLLAAHRAPAIPVDTTRHVAPLRTALDRMLRVLERCRRPVHLAPPVPLADVLAAEAAAGVQLPNDYRALLTLHDGLTLSDRRFFGTRDLRGGTPLHDAAREYIEMSSDYGAQGMEDCVPLAN